MEPIHLGSPKRLTVNLDSSSMEFLEQKSDDLGLSISATVRLILHGLFSIHPNAQDTLPDLRKQLEEYMTFHAREYRGKKT